MSSNENNQANQSIATDDGEISLKDVVKNVVVLYRHILSKRFLIIAMALLGGALGLTYALLKKPVYTASTTFVLEDGTAGGGLSQYSGIASMVGIDIGGNSNGIFTGDNILELYKSKTMIKRALLSPVVINNKRQLFIDRYFEFNHAYENGLKNISKNDLNFDKKSDNEFSRVQDSIINLAIDDIQKNYLNVNKPDKKLSIIMVEVSSKDEIFAKEFTDQVVNNVNQFYIDTKTKKSAQNLAIFQHQSDSIKSVLNGALTSMAALTDNNPNANLSRQVLRVPSQKRQVDAESNKAILIELQKNLELSKITLRKETPLIQVIDKPVYPLTVTKAGKIKSTLIGFMLLGFTTIAVIAVNKVFKNILL